MLVCRKSPLFVTAIEIPFTVKPVLVASATVHRTRRYRSYPRSAARMSATVADKETAVPVPFSVTTRGLVASESLMVSVAARPKAAVGVNVTLMVQLDAAARLVRTWWSERVSDPTDRDACDAQSRASVVSHGDATTLALVVPISRVAKVRVDGDTVTAEIPVPLRLTVCGLPAALSLIVTAAVLVRRAVGVTWY